MSDKLDQIQELTAQIRDHQNRVKQLSVERRNAVLSLREQRVTYKDLAEAMNVSEVTIYKIIKG